jgi:hypothetical protein
MGSPADAFPRSEETVLAGTEKEDGMSSKLYKTELREDGWAIITTEDGRLVKGGIPFKTAAELLKITLEADASDFADRY